MTTFVEVHALRAFPPSNLNRDDLGTPKTAVFGGSRRLRVSSQCLKRTWRTSDQFRGAFAKEQLGLRTDRLPEETLRAIGDDLEGEARSGLLALLTSLGKKSTKAPSEDDEEEEGEAGAEEAELSDTKARTPHLLFLSRQELEAVSKFAKEKKEALAKVFKKKRVDGEAVKKLRVELQEYLEAHTSSNAVDIGLFGRFVTSGEIDTVEGALQVAHGLGTQAVEVEYDYFTAVDDLGDEPGAGHLGESEYASSVLYLYACCDLEQLEKNLGARTPKGRTADDEARKLARLSLPALVRAIAQATPKGKKTGTAPHTRAEYVEVVVRRSAPLSLANAFLKPVGPNAEGGDVMAGSIAQLVKHRDQLEEAYGHVGDILGRCVLCLREEVDLGAASSAKVKSIDEVASKLSEALNVSAKPR
jgi:CRISPR system Cascade subunit CasC